MKYIKYRRKQKLITQLPVIYVTNLLSLVSPWLNNICQIQKKKYYDGTRNSKICQLNKA